MRHRSIALWLALFAAAPASAEDQDEGGRGRWKHPPPSQVALTVGGFQPQSGPPGTLVTITGSGFIKQTAVLYNGKKVRAESRDWNTIRFAVPYDADDGVIVLRQPGAWNDVTVGTFRVVGIGPAISGFSPATGAPGTPVAVYGSFAAGDQISFNGRPAQVSELQPDRAVVAIPPGAVSDVFVVVRPSTGQQATSRDRFVVTAAPPFISSMTPGGGPPGTAVRLSGGNFAPEDTVTYGRAPVTINSRSATHLDVVVPFGATRG